MQRVLAGLREQFVGANHDDGIVVFHGDLEVIETHLLEQGRLPHRRLDQRLRCGRPVLGQQPLVQGTGIDTDSQRHPGIGGGLGDLSDLVVELFDVAGVDTHRGATRVDGGEDVPGLEVDVGDHGDLRLHGDDRERLRVVGAGNRDPDDVAAGSGEFGDLLQCAVDVRGLGVGHRLHGNRCVASHVD